MGKTFFEKIGNVIVVTFSMMPYEAVVFSQNSKYEVNDIDDVYTIYNQYDEDGEEIEVEDLTREEAERIISDMGYAINF